jgi:phosphoribosylanthranilate isomerase
MIQPLIKICGVRSPEIARVVAENGADLMGLIFAPSRRLVAEAQAQQIVAALAEAGKSRPKVVGVFVNERVETMNRLADSVGLDFVQLSGDEAAEIHGDISRKIIKALRLPAGMSFDEARREAERYLDCAVPAWALLLDTHVSGSYGGNGIQGDWEVARQLAERYPIILAGGLHPDSVSEALVTTRPFGVDVSSGVETDGVKDPVKIRQFIAAARGVTIDRTAQAILQVGSSNG